MKRLQIKSITVVLSMLALILSGGCKNKIITVVNEKDYVSKQLKVSDRFTGIETKNVVDVEYIETDSAQGAEITITGPEELIERVKIEVVESKLVIIQDQKNLRQFGDNKCRVTVKANGVDNFITSGTGDIEMKKLTAEDVKLLSTGTGDFDVHNVTGDKFTLELMGTGDADVESVKCKEAIITTSGTGDIDLKSFECSVGAEVVTNGTGDITINSGYIKKAALISEGTGDIELKNVRTEDTVKRKSGSGDINIY